MKEDESSQEMTEEQKSLLSIYHSAFDDEYVDHDLIVALIQHIQSKEKNNEGAVLVFLPGYDDIITLQYVFSGILYFGF